MGELVGGVTGQNEGKAMDKSKFTEWWDSEWQGEPNEKIRRVAAYAFSAGSTQAAMDIITLIKEKFGLEI